MRISHRLAAWVTASIVLFGGTPHIHAAQNSGPNAVDDQAAHEIPVQAFDHEGIEDPAEETESAEPSETIESDPADWTGAEPQPPDQPEDAARSADPPPGKTAADSLFTVTGPDGTVITWQEGETGAATLYYDTEFHPEQTLCVRSRWEWSLTDPEGVLREVSSHDGETVYAMVRPSWEQPCAFTAGDTTMLLYVLMPLNLATGLVVYDEALADESQRMPWLRDQTLQPGQEIQIALRTLDTLLPDPVNLLHTDRPVDVRAEPGDLYFTLTPLEAGELSIGFALGRFVRLRVGVGEPVDFYVYNKPYYWEILSGFELKSSTTGVLWHDGRALAGMGHLVRSSDPDVISVEANPSNPSQYILRPVGFGEATLYVDSEDYQGQINLMVVDGDIPITVAHTDPTWTEFPGGGTEHGPNILPGSEFEGTWENPFVIPVLSYANINWPNVTSYLWTNDYTASRFTSSDPDIVRVETSSGLSTYLLPVNPGVCTITYREGPFVKEVVVRSEPDSLDHTGCIDPGFYTYYGSAHVRRDAVTLEDGLPMVMGIAPQAWAEAREPLDSERFRFSNSGVARVELFTGDLFRLVPVGQGTTTLTYSTIAGDEFHLAVTVGLPAPVWDFVVPDSVAQSGYRLWQSEQVVTGEFLEQELFFGRLVLAKDGSLHTVELFDAPSDLKVEAQDGGAFTLVRRGQSWFVRAFANEPGEYALSVSATPPGASSPQRWEKRLYSARPVIVKANTVKAINEAIRTAPIHEGFETVILLPSGYIPIDYNTPVLLNRPVTLRGQNTVLASDVVALCRSPGAKLQNLTIRFDDASFCDKASRAVYPTLYPSTGIVVQDRVVYALLGDGQITLENCELDAGTGHNRVYYGVGVVGNGVSFQGANVIRNFASVGWVIHSEPGPRRFYRGLTFSGNTTAIRVEYNGSADPYFIRLTQSNFVDNLVNVHAPFPVNFSHNYFSGGEDGANITKSPQYMDQLPQNGAFANYPNLYIEEERLAATELINFEGQASIDTANFVKAGEPVRIAVKELDAAGVGEEDRSETLLRWSFTPSEHSGSAPLFLPDAHIDAVLELPPQSGITSYQGVRFAHHGPLPMEGAEISVRKEVLFQEETLYLYRLADGVLTYLGEVDNTQDEYYTFFLDRCSDYIITNAVVEDAEKGGGGGTAGGSGNGMGGGTLDNLTDSTQFNFPGGEPSIESSGQTPRGALPGAELPPRTGQTGRDGADREGGGEQSRDWPLAYDYSRIPAPSGPNSPARGASANHYIDEAAIRAAFAAPRDGQVTLDVGVKTVVSPLAFQLLAENPSLTLVLKGDGYEWRFSGADISLDDISGNFDTAIGWQVNAEAGYILLSFAQQAALPGRCVLDLEAAVFPQDWGRYDAQQNAYTPCRLNVRQQDRRMSIDLDVLGEYTAIV